MHKKLVNKFFRENPITDENPTAAALAHFYFSIDKNPEAALDIQNKVDAHIFMVDPARKEKILAEKAEIEKIENGDQVINMMRRQSNHANQLAIINKALVFEDETVPKLMKMLKTSLNSSFIETTVRILARSPLCTAEKLLEDFEEIRNPYAQSLTLVLLGFLGDEKHVPWFIEKFNTMKKLYADPNLYEGAYYAIFEIENRFYNKSNQNNTWS